MTVELVKYQPRSTPWDLPLENAAAPLNTVSVGRSSDRGRGARGALCGTGVDSGTPTPSSPPRGSCLDSFRIRSRLASVASNAGDAARCIAAQAVGPLPPVGWLVGE